VAARASGADLAAWLRKRIFQLRVTINIGPSELLSVLQSLDDEKLAPPFTEAKLWLGLEEREPLPAALEQLVTEYRAVRAGGAAVGASAAKRGSLAHERRQQTVPPWSPANHSTKTL